MMKRRHASRSASRIEHGHCQYLPWALRQPPTKPPRRARERKVRDRYKAALVGAQGEQQVSDAIAGGQGRIRHAYAVAVYPVSPRPHQQRTCFANEPDAECSAFEDESRRRKQLA